MVLTQEQVEDFCAFLQKRLAAFRTQVTCRPVPGDAAWFVRLDVPEEELVFSGTRRRFAGQLQSALFDMPWLRDEMREGREYSFTRLASPDVRASRKSGSDYIDVRSTYWEYQLKPRLHASRS